MRTARVELRFLARASVGAALGGFPLGTHLGGQGAKVLELKIHALLGVFAKLFQGHVHGMFHLFDSAHFRSSRSTLKG